MSWINPINNSVYRNSYSKRNDAFRSRKDWWVVRTLEIIFKTSAAEHLVFKGGTSLSKSWDHSSVFRRY
ncbi:Uncharacterised protein [Weeksella virosa]|uniref:nucleotidyl transferase AbiEii/AbiGii toxin family protein n=1 Tax=Weeksella virosa TaxID=1014 RepID=UPI000DFFB1B8|nr:nucleotidyl transferase AbiEii/AbiGii toxin family protein [Weeksella virosa]SUP95242.1 Uncharacterised protein [Weeksella virosa]